MYFLISLLCISAFCYLTLYYKKRRLYQLSSNIPGPTTFPLIGSACLFFQKNSIEFIKRLLKLFDEYPELSKVWIGDELCYLVSKPEYVETVLNNNATLEKSTFLYGPMRKVLGNGLIVGPVNIWKIHRKIIAPSFGRKVLNEYPKMICKQCDLLTDVLQSKSNKHEIEFFSYVTNCTFDIICDTICGVPLNAQSSNENYSYVIQILGELAFSRSFRLFNKFDFAFSLTKEYKEEIELSNKIIKVRNNIIEEKMKTLHTCAKDKEIKHFIDIILEKFLNKELSLEEVEDEVTSLLLAGTDAIATSFSFLLILLGMRKDVQENVYREVMETIGPIHDVTLDDLPKLKYTEIVIKESLRVFPGAPLTARAVAKDISLDNAIIPKGSHVSINFLHLQRNEKYWKDPLKFDPDRFLPERSKNAVPYTWLPFGAGPRNCVGLQHAMMVMKIMTAMIIRKFKLTSSYKSVEDIELVVSFVLRPKSGFNLVFEPR